MALVTSQMHVIPSGKVTRSPAPTVVGLQAPHSPVGVTVTSPSKMYATSVPLYCQSNLETPQPHVPQDEMPCLASASSLESFSTVISGFEAISRAADPRRTNPERLPAG